MMIPKIIHCVWLSGDEKPQLYRDCIESWKNAMPDYHIMEWNLDMFQEDVPWVREACACKKWAYATDYIRLYALYHHGGIYMDMDVVAFKSFDPFLKHGAFSCVEFHPDSFYRTFYRKEPVGLGIEAAVLGAVKHHPWIAELMDYYHGRHFINKAAYLMQHIMPSVLTRVSKGYGFKLIPIYQQLREDVHLYPPDTFSSVYGFSMEKLEELKTIYSHHPVRWAMHLCAHGWWDEQYAPFWKRMLIKCLGRSGIAKIKNILTGNKI